MATVRRIITVYGMVQGVSFRKQTRQIAENLGVTGWVRNLSDGSVEACLEGPEETVDAVISWCAFGPKRGSVTDVQVSADLPPEGHTGFDIRGDHTVT